MLSLTPQMKILLAYHPIDFRKGIDSIVSLCRNHLQVDPFCGTLFVFRNHKANAVKILVYDGTGFWLCLKRFSSGRLAWWPQDSKQSLSPLAVQQLQVLLYQSNPSLIDWTKDFRKLS